MAVQDIEIAQLKARIERLENMVQTLNLNTNLLDSSRTDKGPAGEVEIAIGGSPAKLRYYTVK